MNNEQAEKDSHEIYKTVFAGKSVKESWEAYILAGLGNLELLDGMGCGEQARLLCIQLVESFLKYASVKAGQELEDIVASEGQIH